MKAEEVFGTDKEETRTYVATITCDNCGFEKTFLKIPFGERVDKYLYWEHCPKCGLYMIKRKHKRKNKND